MDLSNEQWSRLTVAAITNPGATMRELAAAAGISRATLHRGVAGRDELMRLLVRRALASLAELVRPEEVASDLRVLVETVADQGGDVAALLHAEHLLERDPELAALARSLLDVVGRAVEAAVRAGTVTDAVHTAFARRVVVDAIWTVWSAAAAGELAGRDRARWAWRLVSGGLAPQDRR